MTGTFDFVMWLIPLAKKMKFTDTASDILKKTLSMNTNRHFLKWFEESGHQAKYMSYSINRLDDMFRNLHDLDHRWGHKIWTRKSYNIIGQFDDMFLMYASFSNEPLVQQSYIFEQRFRALRKHVPSIMQYIERFYKRTQNGSYILRKELESDD